MEPEFWQEEIDKVASDPSKYIEVEEMGSTTGFKVMEEFAFSLEENAFKVRLIQALEGRKPFTNLNIRLKTPVNTGNTGFHSDWRETLIRYRPSWIQKIYKQCPMPPSVAIGRI